MPLDTVPQTAKHVRIVVNEIDQHGCTFVSCTGHGPWPFIRILAYDFLKKLGELLAIA
jgi:hypothetical protein